MVELPNRHALRRGLPYVFFGFALLVFSILPRVALDFGLEHDVLGALGTVLGLLGTCLFALGLFAFVRSRRAGPGGRWLDLALALWLAELALRIGWLVAPEELFDLTFGTLFALRFMLAGAAIAALASWMTALWRDDGSRVRGSWGATRLLFLLQLAGLLLLVTIPGARDLLGRFTLPIVWVGLVLPWLVLYVALRRTMRELSRQATVADVLTS